jgi:ubiquinone biosynthesis accessory factor UbiJ
MFDTAKNALAANVLAAKAVNRVLASASLAGERLRAHVGKRVAVSVGPMQIMLSIVEEGALSARVEPSSNASAANAAPDVAFHVPLSLIPRLLRKDERAYREVAFTGDSELAHTLSTLVRELDWDIEEDLSQLLGGSTTADIIAHRVVSGVKSLREFRDEAGQRFTENMAEYLLHERNAFISKDELEAFAKENEALRDDLARLDARLNLLAASTAPT